MPLPYRKVRYRFKQVSPRRRIRLAYSGNKPVEVTTYHRNNGWVKKHTRTCPGARIRSKGLGRGLAIGNRKGPIKRHRL